MEKLFTRFKPAGKRATLGGLVAITAMGGWLNAGGAVILGITGVDDLAAGANTLVASSFTMGGASYALESVTIPLGLFSGPAPNAMAIEVRADNSGVPADTVVASGSVSVSGTLSDRNISLSGTLNAGSTYWMVVSVTDGAATYLFDRNTTAFDSTGATPANAIYAAALITPSDWSLYNQSPDPSYSIAYTLNGAVVPELAETGLALGLMAAGATVWVRRRGVVRSA